MHRLRTVTAQVLALVAIAGFASNAAFAQKPPAASPRPGTLITAWKLDWIRLYAEDGHMMDKRPRQQLPRPPVPVALLDQTHDRLAVDLAQAGKSHRVFLDMASVVLFPEPPIIFLPNPSSPQDFGNTHGIMGMLEPPAGNNSTMLAEMTPSPGVQTVTQAAGPNEAAVQASASRVQAEETVAREERNYQTILRAYERAFQISNPAEMMAVMMDRTSKRHAAEEPSVTGGTSTDPGRIAPTPEGDAGWHSKLEAALAQVSAARVQAESALRAEALARQEGVQAPVLRNQAVAAAAATGSADPPIVGKVVALFDRGSAALDDRWRSVADMIGETLRNHPNLSVKLIGHTDTSGSEAVNLRLARERAEGVRHYILLTFGIDPSRIEVEGAGSHSPLPGVAGTSAVNRRVALEAKS
jgi:outer membrane protein OmpA-like peptidoglycan-associated protein